MINSLDVSPILTRSWGRVLFPALATLLIELGPQQARADLLLDFTGGNANTFGNSGTVGWEFTLSSPVVLNSLGFWDHGSDGPDHAHEVGIWSGANPVAIGP